MPFDALMMRAVEHRWQTWLVGRTLIRVQCGRDRILWTVRGPGGETDHLLWVLQPGIARVHRTSAANLASKTATPPWLLQILPGRIDDVSVPVLERVMYLRLTAEDDWDQPATFTVVIELAGHLTNLILIGIMGKD